jgi:uncharacterized protein YeaO (DUF488 family)
MFLISRHRIERVGKRLKLSLVIYDLIQFYGFSTSSKERIKMIKTGQIGDEQLPKSFEKWAVVRSPQDLSNEYTLIQALAPSLQLFKKYREAYHQGRFDSDFFQNEYVPQFIQELSSEAESLLFELVKASKEKDVILCCYCEDVYLCHRSILAGILLGLGADIETERDFLKYYTMYQKMKIKGVEK